MKKLLLALMMFAGIAQAQVAGNLGLTSDYRFRGVSQSQNAPAVQGGIDYAHESGLYVGNWNSSVSSQLYPNGAGVESDIYGGYKTEIGGVAVDVGVLRYTYARAQSSGVRFDTQEVYGSVGYGPVTFKVNESTSDYFGVAHSKHTRYYDLTVTQPVVGKLSAVAHAGRTDVANNAGLNYTDLNAGVVYDLEGWAVGARYYTNTNKGASFESSNLVDGQRLYKKALVVSVSKAF